MSIKDSYDNKGAYKYFNGYIHKGSSLPSLLCIKLLQMNAYAKYFDKNSKYMHLLVHDKELLQECNEIWYKTKNVFEKNLIANQCIMINTQQRT